jgi:hypothetical protein
MPASRSACISSPARPKISGSPLFSLTVLGARPGADQGDMAARRRGLVKQAFGRRARFRNMANLHQSGRLAVEKVGPKAPARAAARHEVLNRIAQACRKPGQRSKRRREHPVDPGANDLRQHRAGALGADRHGNRGAVDDCRRQKVAKLRPVDGVGGNVARPGVGDHARVQRFRAGGGKHQHGAVDLRRLVGRTQQLRAPLGGEGGERRHGGGGDDADRGVALRDQPGLGECFLAAADDHDGPVLDPHENGKSVQCASMRSHCGQSPLCCRYCRRGDAGSEEMGSRAPPGRAIAFSRPLPATE